MAGRKTAKKGEAKKPKSSSKKPSKTKKEVKKGGLIEMDKLSRKDFLKQAGIAGAALTAMAAMGGKAKAAGGDYTVITFLDRDARLGNLGVLTREALPESTITFAGVSYALYSRSRLVLRNGMMFSTMGFFKVDNVLYMYYSQHPTENLAWFAKMSPEGIVAEGNSFTDYAYNNTGALVGYLNAPFASPDICDDNVWTYWSGGVVTNWQQWNVQLYAYVPGPLEP